MNRKLHMSLAVAACLAAGACSTVPAGQEHRAARYLCDGGDTITATYFDAGKDHVSFVVLDWNGQEYGLARALSASGARYAGLYGPDPSGHGLEWWEAKGMANLGAFTGKDFFETRPLLTNCRPLE